MPFSSFFAIDYSTFNIYFIFEEGRYIFNLTPCFENFLFLLTMKSQNSHYGFLEILPRFATSFVEELETTKS